MLRKKDGFVIFFRIPTFKIVQLIFNHPNKTFHIRKIAKETDLSTTAVVRAIDELKKPGIIKVEKTDLTTNIKANIESESYCFYKKIFNLFMLERLGLIDWLKDTFKPEAIVLFGSFAKGEDIEESDVDLLILANHKKTYTDSLLRGYEKELNRKINLHILISLEKSHDEFKNAIANGIVLHGYIKVV